VGRREKPRWGSQSWLQPPFEAAPRSTTGNRSCDCKNRDFAHRQRGRLKGGCSQDWLPHDPERRLGILGAIRVRRPAFWLKADR